MSRSTEGTFSQIASHINISVEVTDDLWVNSYNGTLIVLCYASLLAGLRVFTGIPPTSFGTSRILRRCSMIRRSCVFPISKHTRFVTSLWSSCICVCVCVCVRACMCVCMFVYWCVHVGTLIFSDLVSCTYPTLVVTCWPNLTFFLIDAAIQATE